MALFGFGKKKNTEEELVQCDCGGMCKPSDIAAKKAAEEAEKAKSSGCCCGGNCNAETMAQAEKAKVSGSAVKVLGSGCAMQCAGGRYGGSPQGAWHGCHH